MDNFSLLSTLDDEEPNIRVHLPPENDAGWVCEVAFSDKGMLLAAGLSDLTMRTWNTSTGQQRTVMKLLSYVTSLSFFRDDSCIVCGLVDGYLGVVQVLSREKVLWKKKVSNFLITCVSVSPSGDFIASGSGDGNVQLRDAITGKKYKMNLKSCGQVTSISFSNDGELLFSLSDLGSLKVWKILDRCNLINVVTDLTSSFTSSATFSINSPHLVYGFSDGDVYLYELQTGHNQKIPRRHEKSIEALATQKRGNLLRIASGSKGGYLRITDVFISSNTDGGIRVDEYKMNHLNETVWFVKLSRDGENLLSCTTDGYAQIWDTSKSELIRRINLLDNSMNDKSKTFFSTGRFKESSALILPQVSVQITEKFSGGELLPLGNPLSSSPDDKGYNVF